MGFIVRTAGINRTKPEIQRDYQFLMRLWKDIFKKAESASAPYFLYQETDFGVRSLRDYLTLEIDEILVDDVETFRKMRAYLKAVAPRHLRILKNYKDKVPIFERYELEEQIRVIYQERVELKSGGYIIINPTEAMITIDVNSGRGSNKRNIEETAFKTNVDACEEIARQLRLRDLGGLIVIDFIDMIDKKNIAEVEKAFKKALSMDRARIQLSRISKFGLLELSRQKKQSTIQEISYITCPYCKGSGLRPSLEYASLGAFRKIESEAVKGIYSELKVSLPHEIALYILNNKRTELLRLETNFGVCLLIEGRSDMAWDNLEIQQSVKEQTLEVSAMQGVPLLTLAEETESDMDSDIKTDAEESDVEGPPKRKSRRRPRHRKRKSLGASTESVLPESASSDSPAPEPSSGAMVPPIPSAQSPRFPVKPLKIVGALPDEFYPVELDGDLFASEPDQDESKEDKEDH
jgi:ribonuclease E